MRAFSQILLLVSIGLVCGYFILVLWPHTRKLQRDATRQVRGWVLKEKTAALSGHTSYASCCMTHQRCVPSFLRCFIGAGGSVEPGAAGAGCEEPHARRDPALDRTRRKQGRQDVTMMTYFGWMQGQGGAAGRKMWVAKWWRPEQ